MERNGEARRITFLGLVINVFLTTAKYLAGIFGRSAAMIADATHSLSDLLTDLVVFFGLSRRENLPIPAIPTATARLRPSFRPCAAFPFSLRREESSSRERPGYGPSCSGARKQPVPA